MQRLCKENEGKEDRTWEKLQRKLVGLSLEVQGVHGSLKSWLNFQSSFFFPPIGGEFIKSFLLLESFLLSHPGICLKCFVVSVLTPTLQFARENRNLATSHVREEVC